MGFEGAGAGSRSQAGLGGEWPGRIVRDGLPYAPRPFISIALLRDRAHRVGTDSP